MNGIEYSKGSKYIYDLESLQNKLTELVISGSTLINLEKSQHFNFMADISQIGLLSNFQIP